MNRKTDPTRDDHRAPGREDKTPKSPAAAAMDAATTGLNIGARHAPEQTEDHADEKPKREKR
ncbi:hypothetical protein [Jannaschia formosa]|uniref:hypothetical protein n=1 Tax=Jannaschia formosa TaxID=2259592 RepID=UPI000E1B5375|nr:hypothetical protein [Jannaschia formosa]TFL17889.1 hypothetical protein DR046_12035 [Jannaschia formosa]